MYPRQDRGIEYSGNSQTKVYEGNFVSNQQYDDVISFE